MTSEILHISPTSLQIERGGGHAIQTTTNIRNAIEWHETLMKSFLSGKRGLSYSDFKTVPEYLVEIGGQNATLDN